MLSQPLCHSLSPGPQLSTQTHASSLENCKNRLKQKPQHSLHSNQLQICPHQCCVYTQDILYILTALLLENPVPTTSSELTDYQLVTLSHLKHHLEFSLSFIAQKKTKTNLLTILFLLSRLKSHSFTTFQGLPN